MSFEEVNSLNTDLVLPRKLSYKEEHERFISGHNGTTVSEVAILTLTPCASILFLNAVYLFCRLQNISFWPTVMLEFAVIIVPMILHTTVFSEQTTAFCVVMCAAAFACCTVCIKQVSPRDCQKTFTLLMQMEMRVQRPFLTIMRSLVNIGTAVVILGVDFAIFPRRFAKTETFGTGLMDNGVGCFVIINAIVCPEARGKVGACRSVSEAVRRLGKSVMSSLPLLILGLGRLSVVKGIDYHEHASEYGLHWNFFFTLTVVKVVSTLLLCVWPVWLSSALAAGLLMVYQHALLTRGLADFILYGSDGSGNRLNLLDANREGFCSCVGYISVYLTGAQIGWFIFNKKQTKFCEWLRTLCVLVAVSGVCYSALQVSSAYIQPASRRMANMSFVLWIAGLSLQVLASCLLVDLLTTALTALTTLSQKKLEEMPGNELDILPQNAKISEGPSLLTAVSFNGLLYFLTANLLTGFVNMSMMTIRASEFMAVVTLHGYMFVLTAVIMYFHEKKLATRFW